ncbi:MAG: ester cyclase [Actinobacteria bacterium]|nr:MAG: ester cyclase [Actinomycetota bacterium]
MRLGKEPEMHHTAQERNKSLVRKMIEEYFNKRDESSLERYVSADLLDHELPPEMPRGLEGFRQYLDGYLKAFPDLFVTIEDVIAEGDKVVVRARYRGTNQGDLFGMAATGKCVDYAGIDIVRVQDGMIVEHWGIGDAYTMMTQMGIVPEVGETAA